MTSRDLRQGVGTDSSNFARLLNCCDPTFALVCTMIGAVYVLVLAGPLPVQQSEESGNRRQHPALCRGGRPTNNQIASAIFLTVDWDIVVF